MTFHLHFRNLYSLLFATCLLSVSSLPAFAQPCNIIEVITCGTPTIFNPGSGAGDAAYGNGLGTGCYGNPGTGGLEQIYKFKATQSGTYQFFTTTNSPVAVEYFYKTGAQDPCLGSGWTCLGYTTGTIQLDAINLNANDSIWVIANSESASTSANQGFQINCAEAFACEDIGSMTCGIPSIFSVSAGYGDPLYYNGVGTSCYNNSGQGGGESIYQFTAPQSGTYNFSVVSTASSNTVEYFYKTAVNDPCLATGWTCLGSTGSATGNLDAINLTEGESIYLLVNAESSSSASNQSFQFSCVNAFACDEIMDITCGVVQTFETGIGYGDPLFYNGVGTSCYNNSGQGGYEQIYQFTAAESGTYLFEVTAVNAGNTVEYFYKNASEDPCLSSGWTCLGYRSTTGSLDAINLDAGTSIFVLVNAESGTVASSQNFQVRCAEPFACTQITQIDCNEPIVFDKPAGLGNPDFYNGVGTSCYNNSGQGGQESIYQFTAPSDGTYQFRTTAVGSGIAEYLYKSSALDPCENSGWICVGYTSSVVNLDAINLLSGESIWLLVNAESTASGTNQTFVIDCAVPFACTQIEELDCGVATVFNPGAGLGNPDFYNGLGTSCYNNSGQGGRERMYAFTAPSSGTYLFEILNAGQATFAEYMYKLSSSDPCSNLGWICLGYNGNTSYLDAINLNAGESIWLCVNAESTTGANQVFQIRCAQPFACNAMEQITCGAAITYQSVGGYGNPLFNNGLGTSCYSSSGQGGTEKIYQFVAPETGTFSFSVTNVPAGGIFEYFTLAGNLDPCSTSGWQCLNYRSTPGALGTRTLNEGELIYILVNTESLVSYSQSWQVSCVTSEPISIGATQQNILCNGASTGAIDLAVTGGVEPYTYDWADIAGTTNDEDRTGLIAGEYTVTVTDVNGLEATREFTITEAAVLQIISNVIAPTSQGNSDGSIALILVGAPGPYNTDWDDMLGTNNPEDRSNLSEGQYCVTITDANQCVTNTCFDVFIGIGDPLTVEADIVNPLCNGDSNGSITLNVSGGEAPYTIDWSDIPGNDNISERTNLSDGIYEVTVTDNEGATVIQEFNVNEPLELIVIMQVQDASSPCSDDGVITLQITGGLGPYNASWIGSDYTGFQWSGLAPGNYCVEVTDANGCMVEACVEVEGAMNYQLEIGVEIAHPLCNNSNTGSISIVALNGCEPITFDWEYLPGNDDPSTLLELPEGNYALTMTDGNGVIYSDVFSIIDPLSIEVIGNVTDVSTEGGNNGTIFLNVTGGTGTYTYNWNDLSGNGQPEDRTNLTAGEYCVEITDSNGCSADACFVVEENVMVELNVIVMQSDVNCYNGTDGFISLNISGGTEPYVVDWLDLPGSDNGNIRSDLNAGSYEVIITDQDGNTYTNIFVVEQPSPLNLESASVDATSLTSNDGSVNIAVTGGVAPYVYDWSHLSFQNEPEDIEELLPGEYCLTVVDDNGCLIETCVTISYTVSLSYIITDASCSGLEDGSILIEVTGGMEPYQFDWADLPGIDMEQSRFNLGAGTYALTITDAFDIVDEFVFVVGEPSVLEVFSSTTDASAEGNADGSIALNVLGGTPPYQFDWADLPGTNDPEDRTGLLPGQYCVSVTDANQCDWTGCVDVGYDVGIAEWNNNSAWSVYPNPFQETFRIETESGIKPDRIEISDAQGHLVFVSNDAKGAFQPPLAAGVYLLKIVHGGTISVLTLMKF